MYSITSIGTFALQVSSRHWPGQTLCPLLVLPRLFISYKNRQHRHFCITGIIIALTKADPLPRLFICPRRSLYQHKLQLVSSLHSVYRRASCTKLQCTAVKIVVHAVYYIRPKCIVAQLSFLSLRLQWAALGQTGQLHTFWYSTHTIVSKISAEKCFQRRQNQALSMG